MTTRLGRSRRPACFFQQQVGEGLQRLAQAHVVAEDAADVQRA